METLSGLGKTPDADMEVPHQREGHSTEGLDKAKDIFQILG